MTTIWLVTVLFTMTFVYHLYGGLRYHSPNRIKLTVVFAAAFALTILLYQLGAQQAWALWSYRILVMLGWVLMLGLFEGGYSHLLKVVLWLAKVKPARLEKLFPPEEYVLPNDILFETTGILTFVLGVWVGVQMLVAG